LKSSNVNSGSVAFEWMIVLLPDSNDKITVDRGVSQLLKVYIVYWLKLPIYMSVVLQTCDRHSVQCWCYIYWSLLTETPCGFLCWGFLRIHNSLRAAIGQYSCWKHYRRVAIGILYTLKHHKYLVLTNRKLMKDIQFSIQNDANYTDDIFVTYIQFTFGHRLQSDYWIT